MPSDYRGKRVAARSLQRRNGGARSSRNRGAGAESRRSAQKKNRSALRTVICGMLFVFLVTAKLILPDRVAAAGEKLSRMIDRNMDVEAVFSSVGQIFSGRGEWREVYQEVFQQAELPEQAKPVEAEKPGSDMALQSLRQYRTAMNVQADTVQQVSAMALIQYSEQNLPSNVSMQQDLLGFSYSAPLKGSVTSGFGYREHPVEGKERFHYGIDLAAEEGTPIGCFSDGTVSVVGESSSYGKYCIVKHGGGYETLYAHCSRIRTTAGEAVDMGETIAEVGSTGMATGPHLHFELHKDGVYLNPVYYAAH